MVRYYGTDSILYMAMLWHLGGLTGPFDHIRLRL